MLTNKLPLDLIEMVKELEIRIKEENKRKSAIELLTSIMKSAHFDLDQHSRESVGVKTYFLRVSKSSSAQDIVDAFVLGTGSHLFVLSFIEKDTAAKNISFGFEFDKEQSKFLLTRIGKHTKYQTVEELLGDVTQVVDKTISTPPQPTFTGSFNTTETSFGQSSFQPVPPSSPIKMTFTTSTPSIFTDEPQDTHVENQNGILDAPEETLVTVSEETHQKSEKLKVFSQDQSFLLQDSQFSLGNEQSSLQDPILPVVTQGSEQEWKQKSEVENLFEQKSAKSEPNKPLFETDSDPEEEQARDDIFNMPKNPVTPVSQTQDQALQTFITFVLDYYKMYYDQRDWFNRNPRSEMKQRLEENLKQQADQDTSKIINTLDGIVKYAVLHKDKNTRTYKVANRLSKQRNLSDLAELADEADIQQQPAQQQQLVKFVVAYAKEFYSTPSFFRNPNSEMLQKLRKREIKSYSDVINYAKDQKNQYQKVTRTGKLLLKLQ